MALLYIHSYIVQHLNEHTRFSARQSICRLESRKLCPVPFTQSVSYPKNKNVSAIKLPHSQSYHIYKNKSRSIACQSESTHLAFLFPSLRI